MKFLVAANVALLCSIFASAQTAKKTQNDHPTSYTNCKTTTFGEVQKILTTKGAIEKEAGMVIGALLGEDTDLGVIAHLTGHALAAYNEHTLSKYEKQGYDSSDFFKVCSLKWKSGITEGIFVKPIGRPGEPLEKYVFPGDLASPEHFDQYFSPGEPSLFSRNTIDPNIVHLDGTIPSQLERFSVNEFWSDDRCIGWTWPRGQFDEVRYFFTPVFQSLDEAAWVSEIDGSRFSFEPLVGHTWCPTEKSSHGNWFASGTYEIRWYKNGQRVKTAAFTVKHGWMRSPVRGEDR